MENIFKDILKGRVVIVGVGNLLKGDDGLGPALVQRLRDRVSAVCIDAGTAPENFTGAIKKEAPDTVLIVDAADLGKAPGQYQLLEKEDIARIGFTTHDISPAMLMGYLQSETKSRIYMLGIQPEKIDFEERLSQPVRKAIEETTKQIEEAL